MMRLNRYGLLVGVFDAADNDGPKNETLEEHRRHCEAKPGNCPFEKKLEKKKQTAAKEDAVAPKAEAMSEQALAATAKGLRAIFASVAKSFADGFLDEQSFSVAPSRTWDAEAGKEVPTGGFRFVASLKGDKKQCSAFLDKLGDMFGVKRKPQDVSDGGESCRVSTYITGDEAKGVMSAFAEMKKKAEADAQKAAEKTAKKQQAEEREKVLQLATFAVTAAAKTVNFHAEQGDFAPHAMKVHGALNARKDIKALLDGKFGEPDAKHKAQADALLKAIGEIEDSYIKGKHSKVGTVPQMEQPKPKPAPK